MNSTVGKLRSLAVAPAAAGLAVTLTGPGAGGGHSAGAFGSLTAKVQAATRRNRLNADMRRRPPEKREPLLC